MKTLAIILVSFALGVLFLRSVQAYRAVSYVPVYEQPAPQFELNRQFKGAV